MCTVNNKFACWKNIEYKRTRTVLGRLEANVCPAVNVVDVEEVVIGAGDAARAIAAKHGLKLVKDAVVLVEVTKLGTQVVVHGNDAKRLAFHVDVPDLDGQVVARDDIPTVPRKAHVRNRRNDLGEKRLVCWVLGLLKDFGRLVAQGLLAHVGHLDRALA